MADSHSYGSHSKSHPTSGNLGGNPGGDHATSILVVDDHPPLLHRLAQAFRDRDLEVITATNYDEAMDIVRRESPELAVIDLRMPGRSGLELLKDIKATDPATQVVVLTGFGSIASAVEAMRLGATNYVTKPADADEILAAFRLSDDMSRMPTSFEPPTLAQAEWDHINRVLAECSGNVSEAARLLGIHRRSLQRKLKKQSP